MTFKFATAWPKLAVIALGGIVCFKGYQVYGNPFNTVKIPDIASLATIEPAAGHGEAPAESGHGNTGGGDTSFTGKDLTGKGTLPLVTIGGSQILTSSELRKQEQIADLGELAGDSMTSNLINRPWRITPYAHNPVRGEENAKVSLIEFSDLSCAQCMPILAKADAWLDAHPETTRHTQIHSPVGQFQDTNLAAFYGKVAQRGGTFWKYRSALITLAEPSPEKYFNALLGTGIDRNLARRLLNTESRRLYRELDADANLARRLKIGEPPTFVVGTIMVGQQGLPRENIASVLTYQLNTASRQLNMSPADKPGAAAPAATPAPSTH